MNCSSSHVDGTVDHQLFNSTLQLPSYLASSDAGEWSHLRLNLKDLRGSDSGLLQVIFPGIGLEE